ncbi:insulinase family protein [Pseudodesulfovibrio sp. JC047]|uniref:M16 family metallopeptidase n=1 Tax=Pseudodesulfovibrio sp. JC047 TaxID=2683199 RepID=UPI0013D08061|nr:pitrilysin family protein [Pseudodesulfovibrio sp. JC047]NDV18994.1 insulinase family protein [Pseudodesulfovibrio sp. JC047]
MFRTLVMLIGLSMVLTGCQVTHMNTTHPTDFAPDQKTTLTPSVQGDTTLVKLKNGLTVLIKEDTRFPLVNVRLYVHAGSAYETPEIAGISHQLEHMVFKGTDKRGPGETALEIESAGGMLNAATSFDYTVYYVEVPDDKWALGMDVVTDMAFNPTIDPDELKSEKQVVLAELKRGEDTPGSKLFKTLQSMIWKDSSYEWPIIGYRETVQSFTQKDIKDYIATHYQPQSMLLVVTGKVDPEQILAEADTLLGSLENTHSFTPPKAIAIPETGTGPHVVTMNGNWNKVYLGAAFPIPHGSSDKIAGLELLAQLMGGDDTARLYRKFKYEEQLVDSISVSPLTLERGGMFYVHATLDADKVDQFWSELMTELATFDPTDFTDREIERAKLNIEDSMFLTKETLSGLASKIGYFQFFENGEQAEKNYLFSLSQVTRDEMKDVYDEFVRPDQLAVAVLAPEGQDVSAESLTAITKAQWPTPDTLSKKAAAKLTANPTEIALPGGSRLVFLPDETLPYTAMSMYWSGGDGELTPEQQGLASLTAAGLTRGTMKMTATEMQDFLSDHATSLGATAGRNIFAVEAKFPTRFTDTVLPLMTDTLTSPAFDTTEINRAKQDQIAGIKRREDQPLGLAFRNLFPFLYKTGPYSLLHEGTVDQVEAFTNADIIRFWNRQSMRPFTLAVCGQYDPAAIEAFAKNIATTLTMNDKPYAFTTPQWGTQRERTMQLPDRNQSHILMLFPTPGKTDMKTSAELEMLKTVLSGQSGLLFRDLRDKQGLGYTVTSMLWQSKNTGFIALYIGTNPDKVDQSMTGFKTVLSELTANPLPDEELDRAKNIIVGNYYQDHQSLIARSRQAASLMARGFDRNYEEKLIESTKTITPEDLQAIVKKYMTDDKAYIMMVTP